MSARNGLHGLVLFACYFTMSRFGFQPLLPDLSAFFTLFTSAFSEPPARFHPPVSIAATASAILTPLFAKLIFTTHPPSACSFRK